jgi:hypothetical protein
MDKIMKPATWILMIMVMVLSITGCTKKNNLTGNNWSNVSSKTVEDEIGITNGFSFPADTLSAISGSELKLLSGDYLGTQAVAYLRYIGMPRQSEIDVCDVDSSFVKLMLVKRSPVSRNPLKLRLYKINGAWNDTLSVMSNMEYIQGTEMVVPDSISVFGKELKIPLSQEAIKAWETNADSTGWNLAVKVVDAGYVEFRSRESTVGAELNIRYRKTGETSFGVFNSRPVKDSYTIEGAQEIANPIWKLNNAKATRLFIKWEPRNALFTDNDGSQLSEIEIKRLTINKAVIVLHVKNNTYYTAGTPYNIFAYNLKRDSISLASPPRIADYETLVYTPYSTGTISGDSLEVDITPLVQAYVSGDRQAKGISIQSLHERQNFGELEFYDFACIAPDTKRPKVRITYTPPYLKQ